MNEQEAAMFNAREQILRTSWFAHRDFVRGSPPVRR